MHSPRLLFLTITIAAFAVVPALAPATRAGSGAANSSHTHSMQPGETLKGKATYYPNRLNGHKTASGERFHQTDHTAASNKLPLGTDVTVTNLKNGQSTNVTTTDRGGRLGTRKIDLSKSAARDIGLTRKDGAVPVQIKVNGTSDNGASPPK
jgi:rare lipoprotein A